MIVVMMAGNSETAALLGLVMTVMVVKAVIGIRLKGGETNGKRG